MKTGYVTSDNFLLESGRVLTRENLDSMAERIFSYDSRRTIIEIIKDKLTRYLNR